MIEVLLKFSREAKADGRGYRPTRARNDRRLRRHEARSRARQLWDQAIARSMALKKEREMAALSDDERLQLIAKLDVLPISAIDTSEHGWCDPRRINS